MLIICIQCRPKNTFAEFAPLSLKNDQLVFYKCHQLHTNNLLNVTMWRIHEYMYKSIAYMCIACSDQSKYPLHYIQLYDPVSTSPFLPTLTNICLLANDLGVVLSSTFSTTIFDDVCKGLLCLQCTMCVANIPMFVEQRTPLDEAIWPHLSPPIGWSCGSCLNTTFTLSPMAALGCSISNTQARNYHNYT